MLEVIVAQNPFISLLLAYLLGSIPFGVILTRIFGKGNLQKMGSGNIGATNVVRTQGKLLGFSTFFLDFIKGIIACEFLRTGNATIDLLLPAMPVFGHVFPVWLKFKGGKGVATYFGVFLSVCFHFLSDYLSDDLYICLGVAFMMFLATIFTWGFMFAITKTAGIASVVSSCFSLVVFYAVGDSWSLDYINKLCVLIAMVALIVAKHKTNIQNFCKELVGNDFYSDGASAKKTNGEA